MPTFTYFPEHYGEGAFMALCGTPEDKCMKANEILEEGAKCLQNRAEIRDQEGGERSAQRAAAIVSAWEGAPVDEAHIWRVLAAVKMARSMQGKHHPDDYVDGAAYIALLGEFMGNP